MSEDRLNILSCTYYSIEYYHSKYVLFLEQQNYINKKINEIQMAATNKKSALAWQTIN